MTITRRMGLLGFTEGSDTLLTSISLLFLSLCKQQNVYHHVHENLKIDFTYDEYMLDYPHYREETSTGWMN
jgi:hypothetical protein